MLNLDIDKLKQYIKPDALQKSLLIADIQRYIMSLESDNIEEIRDALVNSNYLNDEYLIKRFKNIFHCQQYYICWLFLCCVVNIYNMIFVK